MKTINNFLLNHMIGHFLLGIIVIIFLTGCCTQAPEPPTPTTPEPPTSTAPDISIHKAASKGEINVVKACIAAGMNINATDNLGRTPLHLAALNVHNSIAKLLVKEGANVNVVDNEGLSPLDYAENETFGYLIDHGGKSGAEIKSERK